MRETAAEGPSFPRDRLESSALFIGTGVMEKITTGRQGTGPCQFETPASAWRFRAPRYQSYGQIATIRGAMSLSG